jgi:hypothetical protein
MGHAFTALLVTAKDSNVDKTIEYDYMPVCRSIGANFRGSRNVKNAVKRV